MILYFVRLPWSVPTLNFINRLVKIFRISPRSILIVFQKTGSPVPEDLIKFACRGLKFDEMAPCEVKFDPIGKRMPRCGTVIYRRRVRWWRIGGYVDAKFVTYLGCMHIRLCHGYTEETSTVQSWVISIGKRMVFRISIT